MNINGISLLGKHNPSAMETLRKAMHEEGPVPGVKSTKIKKMYINFLDNHNFHLIGIISLTVARRRNEDYDWSKPSSSSLTSDANSYAPYPDYQHNHLHQLKKASPNNQEVFWTKKFSFNDELVTLTGLFLIDSTSRRIEASWFVVQFSHELLRWHDTRVQCSATTPTTARRTTNVQA